MAFRYRRTWAAPIDRAYMAIARFVIGGVGAVLEPVGVAVDAVYRAIGRGVARLLMWVCR